MRTPGAGLLKRTIGLLAVAALAASESFAGEDPLHLPIGDPARRDREVAVVTDAITETATATTHQPADLADRLKDVRLLLVGEEHTDMESHRIELRVLEELTRSGRHVLVGLEMYPYTQQEWLDAWTGGRISEKEFLEQSHWYKHWGYNWDYYRDIFLLAGREQLRMVAVNVPRELITAVRKKGIAGLSADEASHLPPRIDTESPEAMRLFRAELEGQGIHASMSEEEWKAMFAAQCAWDAAFAQHAVSAIRKLENDPRAILVLLVGSGHVRYGMGVARQAAALFSGRVASLIPVPAQDDEGRPVKTVRASLADFLWGIPAAADSLYPALGLSTVGGEGGKPLSVIHVEKDSVSDRAGVSVGDAIVSFDGVAVPDRETLNRLVAAKRWADAARLSLRRGTQTVEKTILFRRPLSAPKTDSAPREKAGVASSPTLVDPPHPS